MVACAWRLNYTPLLVRDGRVSYAYPNSIHGQPLDGMTLDQLIGEVDRARR